MTLYRICFGIFCTCVNGLYCSLRPLAMPVTWLIVRHWCITRFLPCLSVDCESHLTGLAPSSPARMRWGPAGCLHCLSFEPVCEIEREWKRGRSAKTMKMRAMSVLSVFAPTCTSFPACQRGGCGAFEAKVVFLRQFTLLYTLEFCILQLNYHTVYAWVNADDPKYDSLLFRQ